MSAEEIRAVDSLKAIAEGNGHDTLRIRAYLEWDNYIYIYDPELDLELNNKIVEIGNKGLADKSTSPREKSILNVIYNIKSNKIKKLTLGGCYIEKVNETVLISNEN